MSCQGNSSNRSRDTGENYVVLLVMCVYNLSAGVHSVHMHLLLQTLFISM